MKFKPINGWAKEKILEVIKARPSLDKAMDDNGICRYLNKDGNKCAVGLFIPDGHEGQKSTKVVYQLFREYPDLVEKNAPKSGSFEFVTNCA